MTGDVSIEVKGIEELQRAFAKFPQKVAQYMGEAGMVIGSEIIRTRGLKSYPPSTYRNNLSRGYPYYIRGRGTQTSKSHNMENSERYGSKWTMQGVAYGVKIGNEASYAPYLAGDKQVEWAGHVGWRKLLDVANEKRKRITAIFSSYITKLLKDIGLEVK